MNSAIEIVGGRLLPADLKDALAPHIGGAEIRLNVEERTSSHRAGPGTDVLVAYIGGGTAALSALITGMFALLAARKDHKGGVDGDGTKIVLHGADGSSVECPADATREELAHLVELARRLGGSTIEVP